MCQVAGGILRVCLFVGQRLSTGNELTTTTGRGESRNIARSNSSNISQNDNVQQGAACA